MCFWDLAEVNVRILEEFHEAEVEACTNGDWLLGQVIEVTTSAVAVQFILLRRLGSSYFCGGWAIRQGPVGFLDEAL